MNTIFAILIVAAVAVAIIFHRQINAWIDKLTTADPIPRRTVTLYHASGYAAVVPVLGVYLPSLGRGPRTLAEARLAGWYESREEAFANPAHPVAPPFGGAPETPGPIMLWQSTGTVAGDTLLEGWSVPEINHIASMDYGSTGDPVTVERPRKGPDA